MRTHPVVAVATSTLAPDLDEDGELLLDALTEAGLAPRAAVWDDPDEHWDAFDAVLVRSVWDYPLRRSRFLAWASDRRRIANALPLLIWNTDKHYLSDLARQRVPIVPTRFIEPGETIEVGRAEVVVKPAVSNSAADIGRFPPGDPAAGALVRRLHAAGRSAMIQPYLRAIDTEGETSLVFLGGEFSHAVRREPLLMSPGERSPVVVADVLGTVRAVTPTDAQLALAHCVLDAAPGGRAEITYARVDLIPGDDGPVLLELEATDCYLFLGFAAPEAVARLAEHFARRVSA